MSYEELIERIQSVLPNATISIDYRDGKLWIPDTGFNLDTSEMDADPSELVGDDLDNCPVIDRNAD